MPISKETAGPERQIFATCFLVLFLEMMLIRWVSTELNIFAYLQNSILVTCFLGLGMGLISRREGDSVRNVFLPLSFIVLVLSVPILREGVKESAQSLSVFHDFVVWDDLGPESLSPAMLLASFVVTFSVLAACWGTMVPLGAHLGSLLTISANRLKAYSADILGSLVGVVTFGLCAAFQTPPVVWLLIVGLAILSQVARRRLTDFLYVGALLVLGIMGAVTSGGHFEHTVWTPYQKLQFGYADSRGERTVLVNNSGYQQIQNNEGDAGELDPIDRINQYVVPSRLAAPVRNALVVGAGTGNDVAGILRETEARILAVDIDPVLLEKGRLLHPEKPYQSSRVTTREGDARAIFQSENPNSFDLIVFGLLDAHTTPNLSNARLDNFVYTLESLQSAKRLLTPDGVLVVIFAAQRPYITSRLFNTLRESFGRDPIIFHVNTSEQGWGGSVFVAGDLDRVGRNLASDEALRSYIASKPLPLPANSASVSPTTDHWPYLYIERPMIPTLFWFLAGMLIVLWIATSLKRYGFILYPSFTMRDELAFLLMGMSFTLVQVYSVNKMALLFGSTWFVNLVVVSGILVMILIANWLTTVLRVKDSVLGLGLILLSLLPLVVPFDTLLNLSFSLRVVAAATVAGLPMLISGVVFARLFKDSEEPARALGVNLFGALLGGILQLGSFQFGIPALMWMALLSYSAVAVILVRRGLLPSSSPA